jgi:hypothetical protein
MSLIDRVSAGLDKIGKRAEQAIDEGKLRIELGSVRRRKDAAARDLGYLTYRQSKGEVLQEGETEFLIRRIAKAAEEAARLEDQIAAVRGGTGRGEVRDAQEPAGTERDEAPDAKEPGGTGRSEARDAKEPGRSE